MGTIRVEDEGKPIEIPGNNKFSEVAIDTVTETDISYFILVSVLKALLLIFCLCLQQ